MLSFADFLSPDIWQSINDLLDLRFFFQPVPKVAHKSGYVCGIHSILK
jgi:hypothetical protein